MAEPATEDLKKCIQCKKAIKKTTRYYRDGKYYCNRNCWKIATTGEKVPAQEGA